MKFLALIFTLLLILVFIYGYVEVQLPNVDTLNDVHLQVPLRIYTSDGKLIEEFGTHRRIPVRLDAVPPLMIKAVLDTEDSRFYKHPGVDFISLGRAAKAVVSSRKKVQGASTITMQVARNFFLTRQKTFWRKLNEILLALKIERDLSKDKILELYLNKIYFGHRAYGVAAAAQVYYGEKLAQLTPAQMAMLAGLPQAPSSNNPITNPKAALERRNHVLERMRELGDIDQKMYEEAIRAPLTERYHHQEVEIQASYLAEMVRGMLVEKYGEEVYNDNFVVTTTISSRLQQAANSALEQGLIAYDQRHGFHRPEINLGSYSEDRKKEWKEKLSELPSIRNIRPAAITRKDDESVELLLAEGQIINLSKEALVWAGISGDHIFQLLRASDVIHIAFNKDNQWRLVQVPAVEGALVSLDPTNGSILALTGGFSYSQSHFNRAIQAERQPGSNFKPFIYSAALAKGDTLASIFNDSPIVMQDSGENSLWRPQNENLTFNGPTRLREGLTKSRNLVSIRILESIGVSYALDYVSKFGFDVSTLPDTLSLALGSGTVTPLQMARAFAVFANGGYLIRPYFIQKIESKDKVLYESKPESVVQQPVSETGEGETQPQAAAPRVIDPQNAYLMTQALQDVIQNGTATRAKILNRSDIAGKTGTTNEQMDAWFSGFNSRIVTTVWIGFDNHQALHEYGAQAALPIWIQFMKEALQSMPESTMPQPPDIVSIRIDPDTGLLARPNQSNAIFELFTKDTAPTQVASSSSSAESSEEGVETSASDNKEDAEHLF